MGRPLNPVVFQLACSITKIFQSSLDQMLAPFEECLSPEVATKIVDIHAPEALVKRIQELADKGSSNALTDAEAQEYDCINSINTKLAILQAKARRLLQSS